MSTEQSPVLRPAILRNPQLERALGGTRWLDARARLLELRPDQQEMFARLLTHIESGWVRVKELQRIYDRNASLEAQEGPLADVLASLMAT